MDPNAVFADALEAIAEKDWRMAEHYLSSLLIWAAGDGFLPAVGNRTRQGSIDLIRKLHEMVYSQIGRA